MPTWLLYTFSDERPLDLECLCAFEADWGIRFPPDHVACILLHQGKTPEPSIFAFGDGYETVLNDLLPFENAPAGSSIRSLNKSLAMTDHPEAIIAFAVDPAGNAICFDFRQTGLPPSVVILDHESGGSEPVFVADSFTAFLVMLR